MLYSNNPLRNCSVQTIQLSQSLSSAAQDEVCHLTVPKLTRQILVGCNTSAGQYFVARSSRSDQASPLGINYLQSAQFGLPSRDLSETRGATSVVRQWFLAESAILEFLAPAGQRSLFLPSITANNLSVLTLSYYGTQLPVSWFS